MKIYPSLQQVVQLGASTETAASTQTLRVTHTSSGFITLESTEPLREHFQAGHQAFLSFAGPDARYVVEGRLSKVDTTAIPPVIVFLVNGHTLKRVQRRQHFRVRVRVEVSVHSTDGNPQTDIATTAQPITCHTRDMSAGGILLETRTTFVIGQHLTLKIFLSQERPLELRGRVVRIVSGRRTMFGIEFSQVKEDDHRRINRFLIRTQSNRVL